MFCAEELQEAVQCGLQQRSNSGLGVPGREAGPPQPAHTRAQVVAVPAAGDGAGAAQPPSLRPP